MAFTINEASGNNLKNIDNSIATTHIPVSYTYNSSNKWIYCNYPENLLTSHFGDSTLENKCLNQVTVSAGTHTIFFSYQYNNGTEGGATTPFNFGIQVFNPLNKTLNFRILKSGYGTNRMDDYGSWAGVAGKSFVDFFDSTPQVTRSISANGSYWFGTKELQNYSGLVSGAIQFTVSSQAIITVYAYESMSNIDGNATPVYKADNGGQYSGLGQGCIYTAEPITLSARALDGSGAYFLTNYKTIPSGKVTINGTPVTSDLMPITLANPSNKTISASTANSNLGNWGLIYEIPLVLVNDTDSPVTFKGYVKTDTSHVGEYCIINDNSTTTKYAHLKGDAEGMYNSWNWLTQTVPANSTVTGTYRYVLGTNSCGSKRHIFTVE